MQAWLTEHYAVTYVLIVIGMAFVYNKVFRPRKLPLFKDLIIYLLIALGSVILWIFQIDASLPIVQSLLVAIVLMGLYWLRNRFSVRSGGDRSDETEDRQRKMDA
jgi:hypothetical protein